MKRCYVRRALVGAWVIAALPTMLGCRVGPSLYRTSFHDYAEAIRQTTDEQMLANLVRMRYFQSPIFLQVSNLSTQFAVTGSFGASATLTETRGGVATPGVYGLNANGSYEERPTISFSLPASKEYYGRLLAPLSADQVTSLVLAGFDSELVLLTAVRGLNRLRNLSAEHSNSPEVPTSHAQFREALALIKKLRAEGIVDLELGAKAAMWSSPVAVDVQEEIPKILLLGAASYAMSNDAEIVQDESGQWQTYRFERHMALRFSPAAMDSPDAKRLRALLGLEPDRNNFPIVEPESVNAEKPKSVSGQTPGALDPANVWAEIGLRGRSMLEIMQAASTRVQVPAEDIEGGMALTNAARDKLSAAGAAEWLVIKSSTSKPSDSSVRIKYRGYWFYIDSHDLRSREAFAMLSALFAVVGGTVPGAHPVLTLPVGR